MQKVVWNKKASEIDLKKIHDMCEGVRAKCDIQTNQVMKQIREDEEDLKRIKKEVGY